MLSNQEETAYSSALMSVSSSQDAKPRREVLLLSASTCSIK